MSKYSVTLYYHTYIDVEVEAENEKEAIETAYAEAGKSEYDQQALHNITADGDPEVYPISEDDEKE